MLDLGWQEFFLIAIIAVLVVGPKDLPRVIRTVTQWIRKARSMARDFQGSIEEVAREAELDDIRREAQKLANQDVGNSIMNTVDPDGDLKRSLDETREAAESREDPATESSPTAPAALPDAPGIDVVGGEPAPLVKPPPLSTPAGAGDAPAAVAEAVKKPAARKSRAPAKPKAASTKPAAAKTAGAAAKKTPARKPRAAAKPKTATKTGTKTAAKTPRKTSPRAAAKPAEPVQES